MRGSHILAPGVVDFFLADRADLRLPKGLMLAERYAIGERLGQGGMGAVFEVTDTHTDRLLAAKIIHPEVFADPDLRGRFELEVRITADVRSPHVVPVVDGGVDPRTGFGFLITERLTGEDLGGVLRRRGRLEPPEALAILEQVGKGLDTIHSKGIVHRDIKPENLFVTRNADGETVVRILDFGVAKLMPPSVASLRSTRTLGSPLYMSPEQLEGDPLIDGRADIYALGHVAFTTLIGEAYWEPCWREAKGVYPLLIRMMQGAGAPPSARAAEKQVVLPAGFDPWFARATARDPDHRFDTAGEAVVALREGTTNRRGLFRRRWGLAVATSSGIAGAVLLPIGLQVLASAEPAGTIDQRTLHSPALLAAPSIMGGDVLAAPPAGGESLASTMASAQPTSSPATRDSHGARRGTRARAADPRSAESLPSDIR